MKMGRPIAILAALLLTVLIFTGLPAVGTAPPKMDAPVATENGLVVAGILRADPVRSRLKYAEMDIRDPVRDPGDPGFRNRTARAVLRRGPVDSTGGLAPPFLTDRFWVTWTKAPVGASPGPGAEAPASAWTVHITGDAPGSGMDLHGTWVPKRNQTENCSKGAVGPMRLRGTIGSHRATLSGVARDSTCPPE